MSTSVVFDSNVWEQIADEVKLAAATSSIQKIHALIKAQAITPLFFEGIVNFESIPKKDRRAFIQGYRATISFTESGGEPRTTAGTPAAEISKYLRTTVDKALALGFRFIQLPRIGGPRHELAVKYSAPDQLELGDRISRSFECVRFIDSLGCGMTALKNSLQNPSAGLVSAIQDDPIADRKFSKGVAEWMDGDALAATYGYGHRYFCTCDQGGGAGSQSILHPQKRALFMNKYDVQILTPDELLSALSP